MLRREFYPTIKDYKNMGLTDKQIDTLIKSENSKHGFRQVIPTYIYHHSEPHSIFFLDIKNTLYHSGGHGNNGILGRANDSNPLYIRDIIALGNLLHKSTGQSFTMDTYGLSEDNSAYIYYNFPEYKETARYKLDIPTSKFKPILPINGIRYSSNTGPYKTIFISTDLVETQKKIILFFLLIYQIYIGNNIVYIGHEEILRLLELFEKCNCDYDTFVAKLPTKYSSTFTFMYDSVKKDIETIMNNTTFLSTRGTNLTKAQLMQNFLDRYNIENGLSYEDYNVFACGDKYHEDGPMIKLAFQLGGYGCLNDGTFNFFSEGETIRKDLALEYGIETRLPVSSYGFSDFYNKAIDRNSLQRTWDLAETMQDVNDKNKPKVLSRFRKTNHYIEIKK